jgi:predicted nucleotidyltransferase
VLVVPSLDEIKDILSVHKKDLAKRFKVKTIGVFGSYVRGEQNKKSDIDVLVEFIEPIGLFKYIDLENHLSDLLGVKVDLVMKKSLKPRIGSHILEEAVYV